MLYKKNSKKTLSEELFKNPTSEYRGAPFWAWNTKLDKQTISEQIAQMKEMGFGGYHIHSRTGLDTEYLSDEFMDMVTHAHNEGIKNDMLTWLYDEDRWSSGAAGGKVTVNPIYRRKRLAFYPNAEFDNIPKETALREGKPYLLACYDLTLDKDGYIAEYKRISYDDKAVGTKWYAYCENEKNSTWFNGFTYPDAGNPDAIKSFLDITHERYKEVLGNEFGQTIPAIFTDEPNLNHEKQITIPTPEFKGRILHTWSLNFDKEYKNSYGQDILDYLPELIWNKKDKSDSVIKYRFFDTVAKLFSENFSKQIGEWCEKNGIDLTGHLLREPRLIEQSITCGETMRSYEYFQMPGIDILCELMEFTTAKQAQSDVHQMGKEAMMSELYGVTGWDYDFRGHKYQGDWQAALGVTVRVPHLNWMSMAGEAKRDYPASIGYQSPWYKEYSYIEDHFSRINTALTRGKPSVKIGVIHPIESFWMYIGPNSQSSGTMAALEQNFENVTKWLLESHLDFDFICESRIPSLSKKDKPNAIGEMEYDAIVVPACHSLRKTTIEYLEKFKNFGKKVIFMGECPRFTDGIADDGCKYLYRSCEKINFDKASLSDALDSVRQICILNGNGQEADELIYTYRNDNDCDWLFIAHSKKRSNATTKFENFQNDVVNPTEAKIKIKGEFFVTEYDTLSGEIKPLECEHINGFTIINKPIYAYDSLLLKLTNKRTERLFVSDNEAKPYNVFEIDNLVEFTLSEPNVLLLSCAEYSLDDGEYSEKEELLRADNNIRKKLGFSSRRGHVAQPFTMKKEPETHTLTLRFTFESEIEYDGAFLAMEDVERNTLYFNGERISSVSCGYFTDKSIKTVKLPCIKKGINTIVATLPYGPRTNVEWCYILGDFGVELIGRFAKITNLPKKLGFMDVTKQKMPFYSGNITYKFNVDIEDKCDLKLKISSYRGALMSASVDGKNYGRIVFPPYDLIVRNLEKGTHLVEITLFGNRNNSFGPLHTVNTTERYMDPDSWRTTGDDWCYEYNVKPLGILKSPVITLLK